MFDLHYNHCSKYNDHIEHPAFQLEAPQPDERLLTSCAHAPNVHRPLLHQQGKQPNIDE